MTAARKLWAVLDIMDRQLIDRQDRFAGTVDDVELAVADDGTISVTALLAGPGVLARRMRFHRLGPWLERFARWAVPAESEDPARIPLGRVADIGSAIHLSLDHEDMATMATERWFRDNIIDHIPGSTDAAE
ncbi:MAG: hypothetical protein QOJ00_1182 [Actinomycetota bacterium]|jgi:hypothetical protein